MMYLFRIEQNSDRVRKIRNDHQEDIKLEPVVIMVIEPEESELVENTHNDVWLNFEESTNCI